MIYLISGAPRCGKTTAAKKLSKKLKISWISADTIESMIISNTGTKEKIRLFPKNAIRKKTKQSNDIMYTKYTAKEIRDVYIKQAQASKKAIEMMIECEVRNGNNYIIEGHQIHPQLVDRMIKKYGVRNIRSIVMTRFDINMIVEGCLKNDAKHDWFIQKTKERETFPKIAEMIREYSLFFEKQAKKYEIFSICMDENFQKQIHQAVRILQGE